ncbi:MAG: hypothetical protein IJZ29_03000 [Clostridia bacterium]|nr:hypothetical protein [Clostridia bacterium]
MTIYDERKLFVEDAFTVDDFLSLGINVKSNKKDTALFQTIENNQLIIKAENGFSFVFDFPVLIKKEVSIYGERYDYLCTTLNDFLEVNNFKIFEDDKHICNVNNKKEEKVLKKFNFKTKNERINVRMRQEHITIELPKTAIVKDENGKLSLIPCSSGYCNVEHFNNSNNVIYSLGIAQICDENSGPYVLQQIKEIENGIIKSIKVSTNRKDAIMYGKGFVGFGEIQLVIPKQDLQKFINNDANQIKFYYAKQTTTEIEFDGGLKLAPNDYILFNLEDGKITGFNVVSQSNCKMIVLKNAEKQFEKGNVEDREYEEEQIRKKEDAQRQFRLNELKEKQEQIRKEQEALEAEYLKLTGNSYQNRNVKEENQNSKVEKSGNKVDYLSNFQK